MSLSVKHVASSAASKHDEEAGLSTPKAPPKSNGNYKGFVAGVFSGIAKLSVGYAYLWPLQQFKLTTL
jgi:solute carrier family 25 (mitochondrial carnitine/acylcarnitine transporter), member 20/29